MSQLLDRLVMKIIVNRSPVGGKFTNCGVVGEGFLHPIHDDMMTVAADVVLLKPQSPLPHTCFTAVFFSLSVLQTRYSMLHSD